MAFPSTLSTTLLPLALLLVSGSQAAPQGFQLAGNALISTPLGAAEVYNACPFAVNSNIVHAPRPGADGAPEDISSTLAPGDSGSHPYLHDPGM